MLLRYSLKGDQECHLMSVTVSFLYMVFAFAFAVEDRLRLVHFNLDKGFRAVLNADNGQRENQLMI